MSEMSLSDVVLKSAHEAPPSGRSARRKQERRKRKRRRRTLLAVLVSVVLVGGAVGIAWVGLSPLIDRLTEPDDYAGAGSGDVQVKIAPGSSGAVIGKVLAEADVVKTQKAFVDVARGDTRAGSIQPGTYKLRNQMSAAAAMAMLLDPEARLRLSVTIPEGKRVPETLDILSKQLGLPREDFETALKEPASLGIPAAPPGTKSAAEGFLFPSTYDFEPDVTAAQVLTTMVAQSEKALRSADVPPARWRQVIIEASIVQAEAGKSADMPKVSRVLQNRLASDTKLELDSTVSYATGKFGITTTPQDRASPSRYNTYKYFGLPIGPISSPGLEAIKAALDPEPGPWKYFVTVNPDTGDTRFAVTATEHAANVKIFQAWLRANR
jgi:UPF0755 protein